MATVGPTLVSARHVLHLNLNTSDLEASVRFYRELLGLNERMRSGGDDGDWRFHGIDEPVSSVAAFLYDDRGPRTSPALELVEWRRPTTAGKAYEQFTHRGAGSVRFGVRSLKGAAEKAAAHGGEVVSELGPDGLLVRDPDGVYAELVTATGLQGDAQVAGTRIGCADLDASLGWYAALGFSSTSAPADVELVVAGKRLRARTATVALPDGSADLALTQWLDPVAEQPAERRLWFRGMVRMAISVEDLDASIAALTGAGWKCPEPQSFPLDGTPIGVLRVMFLNDPDGFTVELVHRPAEHFVKKAKGSS
jgi:catechol 2,3-dioxygenase-like lactoylglutathione lyase family enzyme